MGLVREQGAPRFPATLRQARPLRVRTAGALVSWRGAQRRPPGLAAQERHPAALLRPPVPRIRPRSLWADLDTMPGAVIQGWRPGYRNSGRERDDRESRVFAHAEADRP